MPVERRNYWWGLFATAVLLSPTLVSLVHRVRHDQGDFSEFREDGRIALESRQLGPHLPLSYPPTTRPLFMLMAMPPRVAAATTWWALGVWMYWQTAVWAARRWLRPVPHRQAGAAMLVLAAGLAGIISDLTVGQLTALVLFSIMAAFELSERSRGIIAGVALAIPLLIKPLPVILLPYFALRRQWLTLLSAAAAWVVAGPLLVAALFGVRNEMVGWRHFRADTAGPRSPWQFFSGWGSRSEGDETYRRSGLSSTLVRLFRPVTYDGVGGRVQIATLSAREMLLIWLMIVGGVAGRSAWLAWRGGADGAGRAFAGFVCAMLLANPHFISYWLAVELVPVALLIGLLRPRQDTCGCRRDQVVAAAALMGWLASMIVFGSPICRAAGSVVVGIVALAIGVLCVSDSSPQTPATARLA